MCNFPRCLGNPWGMLAGSNKRRGKCERTACMSSHTNTHTGRHTPSGWMIALQRVEKRADEILRGVEEGKAGKGKRDLKPGDGSWDQVGTRVCILTSCDSLTHPIVPPRAHSLHLIPYLISVHHTGREISDNKTFGSSPCTVSSKQMRKIQGWRL